MCSIRILTLSLLFFFSPFSAADVLPDQLTTCAAIVKNKDRLACFDDVVASAKLNVKVSGNELTRRNGSSAQPPIKKAVSTNALVSSFGLAHLYSEKERAFDELTSTVSSAKRNKRGKWILTLENGQVWFEKGGDKLAKFVEGDSVVIKRGIMNSFRLKKIGTKRVIRVARKK